jgi:glycosyltransferase involved in cell wall biosynthesis
LLATREVESTITCLHRRSEGFEREVLDAGFDVRFLRADRLAPRVIELRAIIRSVQPDVVHTSVFEADVAGRMAAIGTGRPVLTSLINMTYDSSRLRDPRITSARLRAAQGLDGWTARHLTSHFHAISAAVKDHAQATLRLRADRITVVERGRQPARLGSPSPERRAASRCALDLTPEQEVVLHVGRHEYQKGIVHLLHAMQRLVETRPNVVLLQAGRRGNTSAELDAAVSAAGLAGRVRFLGHRDDVAEILAAADVFVFPSLYEGLGGAVIEAMALGLPIVASRIPPMLDVLDEGENADLVAVADPGELARAIAGVLDDDDRRRRYGVRSREIFEQRFTLEQVVDRMVTLYSDVARREVRP